MYLKSNFCDDYSTKWRLCGAEGHCFEPCSCLWPETYFINIELQNLILVRIFMTNTLKCN